GVQSTLAELRRRGIPTRVVTAGDVLHEERIPAEVIHPPLQGPNGNENARSLVLLWRQDDLSILLTGDLQGPGLERVLAGPPIPVDVLMAPDHGSKTADKSELGIGAKPRAVLSCPGPAR